ncbi:unnamed protein product [Closterium sp. NIES-65]|nr:unnamed protein product [Closterium sp. NIES-65]
MQAVAAHRGMTVRVSALPLVGMGAPYHRHGIPTIGPAKTMPSGGFIYMDGKQLANDVAAGLLDLTLQQWQAMKRWVEAQSSTTGAIVAVGDVFPLALACLASHHATTLPATAAPSTAPAASRPAALPFAFMGTAKSEFYIRADHARLLPSQATTFARLTVQVGNQDASYGRPSVFLHHPPTPSPTVRLSPARLAAVRDRLTAQVLAQNMLLEEASPSASSSSSPGTVQDGSEAGLFRRGKVAYLGNPMMDHMAPSPHLHTFIRTHLRAWLHHRTTRDAHSEGGAHTTAPNGAPPGDAACQSSSSSSSPFRHVFAILPGSRPPEVAGKLCVDAIFCQPWTLFYLHECPSATSSMSICWLPLSPSRPTSEGAGGGAEAGWVELDGEGLLQGLVLILPEREEEEEAHGNSRAWRGENRAVVALGGAQEEGKGGGSIAAGGSSGGAASSGVGSTGGVRAVVVVVRGGFAECAHEAHGALAMAGTATEQMVGLGKPVFIIPGKGPQFTAVFAEAQTRLLGKSVILSSSPEELGAAAAATMADAALLQEIAANGRIRMGGPGGARRIATAVLDALLW